MSDFKVPAIDDTVTINGEVLRVVGVGIWEDSITDEQYPSVVELEITLQRVSISSEPIPESIRKAFEEE